MPTPTTVITVPIQWYNIINEWVDDLAKAGRIVETPDNPVTRGDVGLLNSQLHYALENANDPKCIKWVSSNRSK